MRVKEVNYFDGVPLLSVKEEILVSEILNYN